MIHEFHIDSPVGDLTIFMQDKYIILCEFTDQSDRISHFLNGITTVKIDPVTPIVTAFQDYFNGDHLALNPLQIKPSGTDHQLKSWRYLQSIPAGKTNSYGEMAKQIGSSPRAVGRANGSNNIALIIPCHRVIGADGKLTGYAGGMARKEWLLRHEGAI